MKALITGANGFIGRHLIGFLKNKGIQVFPVSHQIIKNVSHLSREVIRINPDYIFHLSAYGNHSSQTDIEEIYNANIENTFKLLIATKNINYQAFINFGSSSEYGKKNKPMKESDGLDTDTFYGVSKVASTYLCRAFAKQLSKPIVTIRPFSVYGIGEADFRFIPTVIRSLNERKSMRLDPNPKHDWIYIDDFIFGVYTVLKNVKKCIGRAINIGTGKQYSNLQLVKILEKISGKKLLINKISNMRSYDTLNWVADNSRLLKMGWRQKFSLDRGLKKTYEHYTTKRS